MTGPVTRSAPGPGPAPARGVDAAAPRRSDDARLRESARQMEGAFVQELYKAMRATVPQGEGAFAAGSGEDTFTALMDQHLATETPPQWAHGLGEAIYRHLRRVAHPDGAAAPPDAPAAPTPSPALPPAAAR